MKDPKKPLSRGQRVKQAVNKGKATTREAFKRARKAPTSVRVKQDALNKRSPYGGSQGGPLIKRPGTMPQPVGMGKFNMVPKSTGKWYQSKIAQWGGAGAAAGAAGGMAYLANRAGQKGQTAPGGSAGLYGPPLPPGSPGDLQMFERKRGMQKDASTQAIANRTSLGGAGSMADQLSTSIKPRNIGTSTPTRRSTPNKMPPKKKPPKKAPPKKKGSSVNWKTVGAAGLVGLAGAAIGSNLFGGGGNRASASINYNRYY